MLRRTILTGFAAIAMIATIARLVTGSSHSQLVRLTTKPAATTPAETALYVPFFKAFAEPMTLVGFVRENAKVQTRNLSAEIANRFATIPLSSLDGKPINLSNRLFDEIESCRH